MANQYENTTNNSINKVSRDVKDIRENVKSLKSDAIGLANNLKDVGAEKAAVAAEYVRDQVDTLKISGGEQLEKVEARIKDKPLTYFGAAFAAGIVLSFLFGRRS